MKRRWKVLIGVAVVLAALLALNMVVVNQQTKGAGATVEGARIISLPGGDIQVLEEPAQSEKPGAPIVLLHCYACSLRWWDELAPLLTRKHRVIRLDFLGFGGSEKPASGYSVEDQAQLVAGALSKLDVQGAVVVGESMGASMAVALAEQSSQLVDRVAAVSTDVDGESSELPFLARLGYAPVLGEAMYRVTPDFMVRSEFKDAFASGFPIPEDFEDVIVEDYRAMTYTSYEQARVALDDYKDESPLDARMRTAAVPLMVVLGAADQIVDAEEARTGWEDVPGVRITTMPGVGHTPQIEAPNQLAVLIEKFARDAGPEVVLPEPRAKPKRDRDAKRPGKGNERNKRKRDTGRKGSN